MKGTVSPEAARVVPGTRPVLTMRCGILQPASCCCCTTARHRSLRCWTAAASWGACRGSGLCSSRWLRSMAASSPSTSASLRARDTLTSAGTALRSPALCRAGWHPPSGGGREGLSTPRRTHPHRRDGTANSHCPERARGGCGTAMGVWGSQGSPRSGDLLGQREGSAPSQVLGWRAGLCTWQQQEATASQDTSAQHCGGSGQQKDNSQHRSTYYESSGNSFPTLFFFFFPP